jgi:hypothetical protein
MRKFIASAKALVKGEMRINPVGKTIISRTPGDVTDLTHN